MVSLISKVLDLELRLFLGERAKRIALNCSRDKLIECLSKQSRSLFSFLYPGIAAQVVGDCIIVQSRPSLKSLSSTHYFEGKIYEENGKIELVGKIKAKLYMRVFVLLFVNVCLVATVAALVKLLLDFVQVTGVECVSCNLKESFAYVAMPVFLLAFCWLISRLLFYIDGSGRVENYFKRFGLLNQTAHKQ